MVEKAFDARYEAVNRGFGEIPWSQRATGAVAGELRAAAARHTRVMQAWRAERLGDAPWFGGERFGWADAAMARMTADSEFCTTDGRREYRDHRLDRMVRASGLPVVEAGNRDGIIRSSWPDAEEAGRPTSRLTPSAARESFYTTRMNPQGGTR